LGILRQALASHEWEKTALAPLKKGGISKTTPLAWLPGNPSNAVAPLFKGVGGSECVSPETVLLNQEVNFQKYKSYLLFLHKSFQQVR
jgi:hypothetical protein